LGYLEEPYNVWTGKKPTLTYLKVFGTVAYMLDKQEVNFTQKAKNVYLQGTSRIQKDIDFGVQLKGRLTKAEV